MAEKQDPIITKQPKPPSEAQLEKDDAKAAELHDDPSKIAKVSRVPEGAQLDWRADLVFKARDGDSAAKATLGRIMAKGSEEELKAFASIGYQPADAKLGPDEDGPAPSQPGKPIGTAVHAGTTGLRTVK